MGAVQSFSIDSNGILSSPIDTVGSGGNGPAYCVQFSNGVVAAMNYGSGNGSFTPTATDGKTFDPPSSFVNFFPPPPPNVSNPHMALEYGGKIFVPDLVSAVLYPSFFSIWAFSGFLTSSAFDRVATKFGASTPVVIKFVGSFHSQREAVQAYRHLQYDFLHSEEKNNQLSCRRPPFHNT